MSLLLPPDLTISDAQIYFAGVTVKDEKVQAVTRFNMGRAVTTSLDAALTLIETGDDILGGHACHNFEALTAGDKRMYLVCQTVHDGLTHDHYRSQTRYGFALQFQILRTLALRDEGRRIAMEGINRGPNWKHFKW